MNESRKFFLHVGGHKTATTSLQNFLANNIVTLRKLGIYWPSAGQRTQVNSSWGHHELAWDLRNKDSKGVWLSLAREVETLQWDTSVLVSSEEFSLFRDSQKFSIISALMKNFSIHPIYYMRRQDQLLESIYKYHVIALGETEGIGDFSKRVIHRLSHATLIDCLSAAFGRNNLILRVYGKNHIQENIYVDFLRSMGMADLTAFKIPNQAINKGVSDRGLTQMLNANRKLGKDQQEIKDVRHEMLSTSTVEPWTEHSVLSESERAMISSQFHDENKRIAKDFFGRDELF